MHGGVDGYTRIPVFLKAGTDNSSDTVLDLFLGAVQSMGFPQGYDLIKVVKMSKFPCSCFNIQKGGLGEEV